MSELVPDRPVFIAPAFPFYGRTCIEGVYYVKGQRIDATEYAGDSAYGYSSHLLNDGADDIRHVDWLTLNKGVDAVIEEVDSSPNQLFTFDTRDQTDLELIANAGHQLSATMVGSSGLARAFPKERSDAAIDFAIDNSIPTLFVIGSINQTSRTQKEELSQHGVAGFDLFRRNIGNVDELSMIRELVEERLDAGDTTYIATPDEVTSDESLWAEIEDSIGHASNIRQVRHNIVIVGGETAKAVLTGREITSLVVRSEYEPGIPITTELGGQDAIITKAGGFGYSDTLVDIQ